MLGAKGETNTGALEEDQLLEEDGRRKEAGDFLASYVRGGLGQRQEVLFHSHPSSWILIVARASAA